MMINDYKKPEDRVYIPRKTEYDVYIVRENQLEYLKKRIRKIRLEAIEDKKRGYNIEPKMYVEEIEEIFGIEEETLPFEPELDDLTADDLADAGVDTYAD